MKKALYEIAVGVAGGLMLLVPIYLYFLEII